MIANRTARRPTRTIVCWRTRSPDRGKIAPQLERIVAEIRRYRPRRSRSVVPSSPPSSGPRSATTPTIEECQIRLGQIGSEIRNSQIMFDGTTNGEVRSARRADDGCRSSRRRTTNTSNRSGAILNPDLSRKGGKRTGGVRGTATTAHVGNRNRSRWCRGGGRDAGTRDASCGRSDHLTRRAERRTTI